MCTTESETAVTSGPLASDQARTLRPAAQLRDGKWVIQRAVFGLALVVAFAFGSAILYHASIDPTAADVTASE